MTWTSEPNRVPHEEICLVNFTSMQVSRGFIRVLRRYYATEGPNGAEKAASAVRNPQSEVSRRLHDELESLQLVPLGQNTNMTDLEKQDATLREQLNVVKTQVRMKAPRPISPSMRWYRWPIYPYLYKGKPIKALTVTRHPHSGRNYSGRITVRHQGGGKQRRIRIVDLFRINPGIQKVLRIEHDPNRSSHLALLKNEENALSYIPATVGMREGDEIESFRSGIPQRVTDAMGGSLDPGILAGLTAKRGNCLPMHMIPLGTVIHNIGITPQGPAKFCRSAGTYGRLYEKVPAKNMAVVRLQSGETRYVSLEACATIGIVSNPDHEHRSFGKAGRSRNLGIRPTVRGVAMNKVDHPLGGGRGKSKGNKIPVSPWGVIAKGGYKTRRGRNQNRLLIRGRPRGRQGAN